MPAAFVNSEVAAGCVRFCTEEANAQAAVLAQAVVYAGIADAAVACPRIPLSYRTMRRGARSMVASPSGQRDPEGRKRCVLEERPSLPGWIFGFTHKCLVSIACIKSGRLAFFCVNMHTLCPSLASSLLAQCPSLVSSRGTRHPAGTVASLRLSMYAARARIRHRCRRPCVGYIFNQATRPPRPP